MSSVQNPPPDGALAAWLGEAADRPWYGAVIWRVHLDRASARILLLDLARHARRARVLGVLDATGVWLYLWQPPCPPLAGGFGGCPGPGLGWLLAAYSGAALVNADQVRGGPAWACGKALARLLGGGREREMGARSEEIAGVG
jgi:hypothetical protein